MFVFRYGEFLAPVGDSIKQKMESGNGAMMNWMKRARRAKLLLLPYG